MALTSIKANGMRSLLTMLGIIIGVGAVVAMVALGDGVKAQTTDSFGELGANTLNIMPEGGRNRGVRQARSAMQSLKTMDAEAIEKKVKGVQYVSPVVSSSYQVVYGNENVNTNVRGVKPAYLQKNSITVKKTDILLRTMPMKIVSESQFWEIPWRSTSLEKIIP